MTSLPKTALFIFLLASLAYAAPDVGVSRAISPVCSQVVDAITHASKTVCKTRIDFTITNLRDSAMRTLVINQTLPSEHAGSQASVLPICTAADLLVSCTLSNIAAGASERFAFELSEWRNVSESAWPAPVVSALPILARLKAPAQAELGGNVVLELRALDGTPLSGARIEVQGPESTFTLVTNPAGLASFKASSEGFYSYIARDDGVSLSQGQLTTKVAAAEAPLTITAALRKDLPPEANKIVDLLPLFLAFALLVLVALVWGFYFYATRPKEEPPVLPPQPPFPKAGTESSSQPEPDEPVTAEFEKAKDAAEITPPAEPEKPTEILRITVGEPEEKEEELVKEEEEEKKPPEKRLPSVFRPKKKAKRGRPKKK
ncbi:MAG: hypothetical protein QXH27_00460 [Candidatus Micrarchaeia archaeon]